MLVHISTIIIISSILIITMTVVTDFHDGMDVHPMVL